MNCPFCGSENLEGVDQCATCEVDLTDVEALTAESGLEIDLLQRPLGELAASDYVTVTADTSVRNIIRQLNDTGHHCAIVQDGDRLTGILTARDILNKLTEHFAALADDPIAKHMTPDPVTLEHNDPVAFGLNRMMVGGYRHIPVLKNEKLCGVVSVRNVLKYLVDRFPATLPTGKTAPA